MQSLTFNKWFGYLKSGRDYFDEDLTPEGKSLNESETLPLPFYFITNNGIYPLIHDEDLPHEDAGGIDGDIDGNTHKNNHGYKDSHSCSYSHNHGHNRNHTLPHTIHSLTTSGQPEAKPQG